MTIPSPGARSAAVGAMRVAGALSSVALANLRANAAEATQQRPGRPSPQPVVIAGQLLGVAEDIVSGARKDPSMVFELMQGEASRRLSALGLATSSQVEALRAEVAALRVEVSALKGEAVPATDGADAPDSGSNTGSVAPAAPAKGPVTKSPPSRKMAGATKSPSSVKAASAEKESTPAEKKAPAKKTTATKKTAPARKAATTKSAAKMPAAKAASAQDSAEVRPLEGDTSPQDASPATAGPEQTDERTERE